MNLDSTDAYDYDLPEELIAAYPVAKRDQSKLLVARRSDATIRHKYFSDIVEFLTPDDLLVFNNTRVLPGRIRTKKTTGGKVELLVLDIKSATGANRWTASTGSKIVLECMTRASKPLRPGMILCHEHFDAQCTFTVLESSPGNAILETQWSSSPLEFLEQYGEIPLPPYILQKRHESTTNQSSVEANDAIRYQTVYAKNHGAIAAPTAGLHFTEEIFRQFDTIGIKSAFLTLQVGPGTFRPVSTATLDEHPMHREEYTITPDLSEAIRTTRQRGGRIIAVGTTSARALEAEALLQSPFEPGTRSTDIFLRPGKSFQVCDGLVTNFHLPRSTLLALVAAFTGYDFMKTIYTQAIEHNYRFYSYGDSSIIL